MQKYSPMRRRRAVVIDLVALPTWIHNLRHNLSRSKSSCITVLGIRPLPHRSRLPLQSAILHVRRHQTTMDLRLHQIVRLVTGDMVTRVNASRVIPFVNIMAQGAPSLSPVGGAIFVIDAATNVARIQIALE